jgi:diguanylate cyclase (GGDEF)-like protein
LQTALTQARRERTRLALLYIDLDMFKPINDTFGHAIGDLLLQEVALRLKQCVREADTVGRVGGDEFVVLLGHIQLAEHAALIAEKILLALAQPFELAGNQLHISPSIGIALYPEHGGDYLQLIRCADEAMYGAKKDGGNKFLMTSAASVSGNGK